MRLLTLAAILSAASIASAHGVPIELSVADGSLTVSHFENDYGPYIFGQVEDESDPIGPINLPGFGPALLWGLPGIDITGMADTASLVLEPIAHPFEGELQTLWYWDPLSRRVIATPDPTTLVLQLSDRDVTLSNDAIEALISLAETVAGQTSYHNHSLVDFAIPYSTSFNLGLYGFFARLTSNEYAPSEQFLITFNAGAAYEDLAPASEAIWLAANPGDYTLNGVVDAADYDAWVANYGSTPAMVQTNTDGNGDGVVDAADYTLWRDNLSAPAVSVPEPGAMLLFGVLLVGSAVRTVVGRKQRPLTPNTNLASSR
jgi:hypothetical protein